MEVENMKRNFANLKMVILLTLVMTTITTWAQTPVWQQQLDSLDKEADVLYEKQNTFLYL